MRMTHARYRPRRGQPNKNGAARAPSKSRFPAMLLDLGFAEFDMLARNRVILLLDQLVGHGARVLLGDVIEAGVGRGHELDLDGDRFGHVLQTSDEKGWAPAKPGGAFGGQTSR